ncbi:hypothetical protein CK203_102520 [Vitis vinifera]|uniref:Uncharacterized protein n=1 Tax=Vitis vinifera TaxID=29760 RepID=A0A438DV20_VITVI|nr:hypothetical protein CK203_102520 [Vitis vinifera]
MHSALENSPSTSKSHFPITLLTNSPCKLTPLSFQLASPPRIHMDSWWAARNPNQEENDSDDEWIAEKEDSFLPLDLCWLQDNELFNVDAIRVVSSNSQKTQASLDHMVSSHSYKRKHNEVPSTSRGKDKDKELNLTPIDEDEDLHEMGIHDGEHFPTIDTLDEDDDDLRDEDLS